MGNKKMIDVFIPTVIYFAAANVVSLSLSSHIRASIIVMLLPCLSCAYFDYLVSGNYCFLSTAVRTSQVNNSLILKCYRTKLSTHVVVDVKFIWSKSLDRNNNSS